MFKKILQSLSKSHTAKSGAPTASAAPAKPSGVLEKIVQGAPVTEVAEQTPEELCDIVPKMGKDQIQARLKLLYRRYNHSASSLDPKLRAEADKMLNAIVMVREKHFGEI